MNCLRMSPGTSRKYGAILRKCAAQAARSMLGGRRYWTIAVIMDELLEAGRAIIPSSRCAAKPTCPPAGPSVFGFWFRRSPARHSGDRRRQGFAKVDAATLEDVQRLRYPASGNMRELFQLGLFHALKY